MWKLNEVLEMQEVQEVEAVDEALKIGGAPAPL